nr:MAG TPA: hypothetical protein [Caudoviricetes sp.]
MKVLYKGNDITSLVNLMIDEYNDRYHLEAFKDSGACERYAWIRESAINAAKDITDLMYN